MPEPQTPEPRASARRVSEHDSAGPRRLRPVPLLFEPNGREPDVEHFFDLESIDDPAELLRRSTELTLAFRAAAERATEYQAVAAAQLADPRRFDALSPAQVGDRAGWTADYAAKMVEHGRSLQQQSRPSSH